MKRMKKYPELLITMLVTICLCTACGKENVIDTIKKMYEQGIERVEKSESIEEVQRIYDEVTKQVKYIKSEHQKELTSLGSTVSTLQKTEDVFVRACCIKLNDMNSFLKTEDGLISIDEKGNFYDPSELPGDDSDYYSENPDNPLNIIDYSYICLNGNIEYITVLTSNGVYLYNEEDAEQYYDYYVPHFFWANMIVRRVWYSDASKDTKQYVKGNLFRIVSNLPLDISYPKDVMERVNKIYYKYMDKEKKLHLLRRNNGRSIYDYNGPTKLYLGRDPDHGGILVIREL